MQFRSHLTAALIILVFGLRAQATEISLANVTLRDRVGGGNIVTHLTGAPTASCTQPSKAWSNARAHELIWLA